ncbi:MAG: hypothetical protein QHH27_04660 [Clostridia bacterium]|nr:hypothetical protein [Clostridia bacterium]MDH7572826.1 hypothetical protein [Clostridia bacterium]
MRPRMVIITSYFQGQTYGMLGPQLAATVIQENTPYECLVVALTGEEPHAEVRKAIYSYLGEDRPVVGFSTLSGRPELFELAASFKQDGVTTVLGGPQAAVDFLGEEGKDLEPHRFQGYHRCFSFAVQGPAEQIIPVLQEENPALPPEGAGIVTCGGRNPARPWDAAFFRFVRWDNLYRVDNGSLVPLKVESAQVIQQLGCPYAVAAKEIAVDYPTALGKQSSIPVRLRGCSFCDVATDKGYAGRFPIEVVVEQIRALPEENGSKIPFELINENPLPQLPRLLDEIASRGLKISQVDLVMRADWFVRQEHNAREALKRARERGILLRLASVGLESFDDRILRNLNKGTTRQTNLAAVDLMRRLKDEFPDNWAYASCEGSVHGLIHPTPWDTAESLAEMQRTFAAYGLPYDVLPAHSVPLIIHHACPLGDWARELEAREGIRLPRSGSVIGWWALDR